MKTARNPSLRNFLILTMLTLSLFEGGCVALRPVRALPSEDQAPLFIAPTLVPTSVPSPTVDPNQQPENCTNKLTYLKDLSVPDGSVVNVGASVQKQWQVRNDGTCNWNETYTIRLIGGSALGAASPQSIVPARGGADGVIQIAFIAPDEPGNYTSTWQAYDPSGNAFGDFFSIEINVAAP